MDYQMISVNKELLDDVERRFGRRQRNELYEAYCEWRTKSRLGDRGVARALEKKLRKFQMKKQGLCFLCGAELGDNGGCMCASCRVKHNNSCRGAMRIKLAKFRKEQKKKRVCSFCGGPISYHKPLNTKYCCVKCVDGRKYQVRKMRKLQQEGR